MYTLIYFFVMMAIAAHTYHVLRKTHKKKVIRWHAAFLFIAFSTMVGIASMSYYADSKDKSFYLYLFIDKVTSTFERECTADLQNSTFKQADMFYTQSNLVLCSPGCPCRASIFISFH